MFAVAFWSSAMLALWIGSPLAASTSAEPEDEAQRDLSEASWAFAYWAGEVQALATVFGIEAPEVTTVYEHDPALPSGSRSLFAYAEQGELTLRLSGPAWRGREADAEALLTRNAAHEVAHSWQLSLGPAEDAPRWLHEGFADALSRDALAERGAPAEPAFRCAGVLRRGEVRSAQRAGDQDALYDCGSVIVSAVAAGRGETVRALYEAFADAGFTEEAFLRLAGEARMDRSVRAFLITDYTLADPAWVIESLRAGRL